MRGIRPGFIQVGQHYLCETSIAAITIEDEDESDHATATVYLNGGGKIPFTSGEEDKEAIEQLKSWATKPRSVTSGEIGMGPRG